jgi:signal transduction histidine kinase
MGEVSDFLPPARCRFAAAVQAIGAGIWLLAAGSAMGEAADLISIAAVKATSATLAGDARALRVRGVVNWRSPGGKVMFLQDDSDGIFAVCAADQNPACMPDEVGVGTEVEIEGMVAPTGFAPNIRFTSLRALGQRPFAEPVVQDPARFFTGADDSRLISVTGIVRGVYDAQSQWRIVAETDLRTFDVEFFKAAMPPDFGATLAALPDSTVRFIGVAAAAYNPRGEFLWPRVYVSKPEWVTMIEPAQHEPFASPYVPLNALARYRPDPPTGHRIRTAGTVVHAVPGKSIFLQDHFCGTLVRTQSKESVQPGDRVEAAGFIDRRGPVAGIADAVIRVIASGAPPQVIAIAPDEIIAVQDEALSKGVMAAPGDYEGCLVEFPAQLLEKTVSSEATTLFLLAGQTTVAAVVDGDHPALAQQFAIGCEVSVTGIVQGLYEQSPERFPLARPSRFTLLLRSPGDVRLVRAAPWWTRQRLAVAAGGLAVFAMAAAGWAGMLRREVRRQTAIAVAEETARREAAAEYEATLRERSRLAANLHDTILQTVTGIGFQLKAGVASHAAAAESLFDHVALAQKMVDHAASQLRGTVWSLRSLPLDGSTFPEALEALVQRLGERQEARIEVSVSGPADDLPDVVAGNLLLVIQEAIHNALLHGAPKLISLRVECGPGGGIAIEVHDDGSGFDPDSRAGPSTGHFGLEGMRERMERLHGTLAIESRPGGGTAVRGAIAGPARAHHLPDRAMGEAVG